MLKSDADTTDVIRQLHKAGGQPYIATNSGAADGQYERDTDVLRKVAAVDKRLTIGYEANLGDTDLAIKAIHIMGAKKCIS